MKKETGIAALFTRTNNVLLFIALVVVFTAFGRAVVLPVIFAILFGIVLRPVERFLNRKLHIPRVIAILMTVIFFMLLITAIVFFTTYELTRFMDDLPTLKRNLATHLHELQDWAAVNLKVKYMTQEKYLDGAANQAMGEPGAILQKTMQSLSAVFTAAIVLPVLLFLVLYYRPLFLEFILKVFGEKKRPTMQAIIGDTRVALQGYVFGLFLEMVTVTLLQTLAMYIVGVKYALFIGLTTGVLNMIPYIGILVAGCIGLLISLATGAETSQLLYVVVGFACVQFIDNNILLPNLVGSRVRINAFFSIVGVIAGGIVCGVAGMFLAIPVMALMKVIFDNVESLKPWGELMGDSMPRTYKWKRLHFPKMD